MLLAAKGSQKLPGATSAGRAGTSIPDFENCRGLKPVVFKLPSLPSSESFVAVVLGN